MLSRKFPILLMLAGSFSVAANAADPKEVMFPGKGSVMVYGFTDQSCGDWQQERRTGNNQANTGWVLGLIAGLNAYGPNAGDIAPDTNATGLLAWVDKYCAENPLDSVQKAGLTLGSELQKRARQK